MKPNYGLLIRYLNEECNLTTDGIASLLDYSDSSIISKIKNNTRKASKKITPQFFYDQIFKDDKTLTNDTEIYKLYNYLGNHNCVTPQIQEAYADYQGSGGNQSERAERFLMAVFCETDRNLSPISDTKPREREKSPKASETRFVKFTNPIQGNTFVGRKDTFDEIREKLTEYRVCILCGIGGMGKSYCSLKYAETYSAQYSQVQQVFYSETIKDTVLKIQFEGLDESHCSESEKLEKRFSVLSGYSDDTLLIIDNMDTCPPDKDNYERLKKLPVHVIFTSRQNDFDLGKYFLPVQPLPAEEQLDLFKDFCDFEIEADQIPEYYKLFEKVEGHTLLLELIAKTMSSSDITPAEMMEALSNSEAENIDQIHFEMDNHYHQEKMNNFVCKLFDTSDLNKEQKNVLMHLSLASTGGLRRRLFKTFLGVDGQYINTLIGQSWIISPKPSKPTFRMIHLHPVIRSAVIRNTEPTIDKCKTFIVNIVETLRKYNSNSPENELEYTDISDLCDILTNAGELFTYRAEHIDLIIDIIDVLWKYMSYSSAYNYCLRGIGIINTSTDIDIKKQITLYEKAGQIAVRLARYEDGIHHYNTAISIIENKKAEDPESLASLYDNLGVVMRKSSKYEEALDCLTKAQNIIDVHHVNNRKLTANIYNDMGVIYINLDLYNKALENYQKARELREKDPNPDKAQLAYSYHNIGTVYQRKNDYASAIDWHQKALDIRREIYPENEPIIAASLTMIGNDYSEAAKDNPDYNFEDARKYFEEGLKIRKTTLGENHPDTAWSHHSIGKWYFYQEDYVKALEHFQKCLSIRRTALGEEHAYTAEVLFSIGEVYFALGDKVPAESYLKKACDIQTALHKTRAAEKSRKLLHQLT